MKKSGFTLAEVLMTLGIVGVVSSLTIPNLNMNTSAAKNKAILKSTISVLANAAQTNMSNNGWDFSGADSNCANPATDTAKNQFSICGLLNSSLVGERYIDTYGSASSYAHFASSAEFFTAFGNSADNMVLYQLNNGSIIGLSQNFFGARCNQDNYRMAASMCTGFIDVNGKAGPNKVVTCQSSALKYIHNEYPLKECEINSNTNADIFPIKFFDSTVELSSNAGISYLYGAD